MNRVMSGVLMVMPEVGGLIVFGGTLHYFGLRAAIALTLAFVLADGLRHAVMRIAVTKLWLVSNGMALVFGMIDLHAQTPFMIRYEASVTNVIVGLFFAASAFGNKPMVEEVAERRQGYAFPDDRPDLRAFFRAFTLVWAGYFFIKAAVYLWLMQRADFQQALVLRWMIGSGSFLVMMLISARGRAIRDWCVRHGMFVPAPDAPQPVIPAGAIGRR